MRCDECKEFIWNYLMKELEKNETTAMEEHLKNCSACAELLEETREVVEALQTLPQEELPPQFHSQLMAKLAVETKVIPLPMKKNHNRWKQLSMIAAAALVVVAVGGSQGMFGFTQTQDALRNQIAVEKDNQKETAGAVEPKDIAVVAEMPVVVDENSAPKVEEPVDTPKISETPVATPKGAEVLELEVPSQEMSMYGSVTKERLQRAPVQLESTLARERIMDAAPMPLSVEPEAGSMVAGEIPKSTAKGRMATYSSADEAVVADDSVILTVPSEEGVIGKIRELAGTYVGYEVETSGTNGVTLSIPREQVTGFYEALEELGDVRKLEESHEEKDAEIIEITLEVK